MKQRTVRVLAGTFAAVLCLAGCGAPPIPQEKVPEGWTLDVHQPGEWWTQPLIPRSVIVQRCAPPPGWGSAPDLTKVTALPPGSDVEFTSFVDEYRCDIGWSEARSRAKVAPAQQPTEAGLRRICSTSGLPMDAGWRFLGQAPNTRSDYLATAAFIDDHGTVVACLPGYDLADEGMDASVELSVGADIAAGSGNPSCPATAHITGITDDRAVGEYRLRGAGAVRDDGGRVLTQATTVRIGLVGDAVTSSHRGVDGVAIVDAWVTPRAAIQLDDADDVPAIEGQILDGNGKLLAICRQ